MWHKKFKDQKSKVKKKYKLSLRGSAEPKQSLGILMRLFENVNHERAVMLSLSKHPVK